MNKITENNKKTEEIIREIMEKYKKLAEIRGKEEADNFIKSLFFEK